MPNLERIFYQFEVTQLGGGRVENRPDGIRLTVPPQAAKSYTNAQITDYRYKQWDFRWSPSPNSIKMSVTAQASAHGDDLRGTAGFGFWNHPISPDTTRLPRLPRAVWFFFGSPPNDMRLALDVAGNGWKAATLDAAHLRAAALAPFAPALMLAMRVPALYQKLWRRIQPILKVSEVALDPALLAESHTYSLEWSVDRVIFAVDGRTVHETPPHHSPRGKLGFIAWIDNQYAITTPQGHFKWGVIPVEREQWLHISDLSIE
jgi:hypothetical protein